MNPKEKLKFLMGARLRRLWLLGVKDWHLYYTPEDAEEIGKWDESEAKEVWERIYRQIVLHNARGFDAWTFPWCVYVALCRHFAKCKICGYGKRHGECDTFTTCRSDFCRIVHQMRKERRWSLYIEDKFWDEVCFPNEWYRKVVEKLEREK